jgi:hypothetical protein
MPSVQLSPPLTALLHRETERFVDERMPELTLSTAVVRTIKLGSLFVSYRDAVPTRRRLTLP